MGALNDALSTLALATAAARDVSLVFLRQRTQLAALKLDATLSESVDLEADVTENPVEDGSPVTDHIRTKPITLKLEGIVTDDPVDAADRLVASGSIDKRFLGGSGRAADALQVLTELWEKREPITVVTRRKTYERMAIQSLGFPDDPGTGAALRVSATLRQIHIVSGETVPVLEVHQKVDRGRQVAPAATPPVQDEGSILYKAWQWMKGS